MPPNWWFPIVNLIGIDTAAGVAVNYRGGGKTDWYLGNNKEMQTCYENIARKRKIIKETEKINGFVKLNRGFFGKAPSYIWTSEQESAVRAYQMDLERYIGRKGGTVQSAEVLPYKFLGMLLDPVNPVRPIRKF